MIVHHIEVLDQLVRPDCVFQFDAGATHAHRVVRWDHRGAWHGAPRVRVTDQQHVVAGRLQSASELSITASVPPYAGAGIGSHGGAMMCRCA